MNQLGFVATPGALGIQRIQHGLHHMDVVILNSDGTLKPPQTGRGTAIAGLVKTHAEAGGLLVAWGTDEAVAETIKTRGLRPYVVAILTSDGSRTKALLQQAKKDTTDMTCIVQHMAESIQAARLIHSSQTYRLEVFMGLSGWVEAQPIVLNTAPTKPQAG